MKLIVLAKVIYKNVTWCQLLFSETKKKEITANYIVIEKKVKRYYEEIILLNGYDNSVITIIY